MNINEDILVANRGRNPRLLAVKWAKMRTSPFRFFRGAARLFYTQWSAEKLPNAPLVWICGDAHTENVGSYKGDDHVAYFDLNDFDEACLAPAHYDLGRALGALYVLRKGKYAAAFLDAYGDALRRGKPRHIEPEVAQGPVLTLLTQVKERSMEAFLASRVKRGKLKLRTGRSFALDRATKVRVKSLFDKWARTQPNPSSYRVRDICGRIAGTGSLGLERYTLLVAGLKTPMLMDMKEACPSAAQTKTHRIQPKWKCEAQRVATTQYFMQYVPIAGLSWIEAGSKSCILRQLQPTEDRIDITKLTPPDYDQFVITWARLLASAHIRSGGWNGSATFEALIKFGNGMTEPLKRRLLKAASRVAALQLKAYANFKKNGPK